MPSEPVKFRCDRCGQLLGVAPSRAGRAVNCPKCGTSLVVPDPDAGPLPSGAGALTPKGPEEPSSRPPGPGVAKPQSSGFFDAIELSSDELRTLFPEDESEAREEPGHASEVGQVGPSERDPEPRDRVAELRRSEEIDAPVPEAFALIVRETSKGPEVPTESPDLGTPNDAIVRARVSRDVVIPRLALLSWSLFVLIALFLAFVSGLLVGHFVWVRPG